jgi:hypothetical protein
MTVAIMANDYRAAEDKPKDKERVKFPKFPSHTHQAALH